MFGKTMSVPDALLRSYFDLSTALPAEQAERLLAAGVSAVFSDRPDLWRRDEM